MDTELDNLNDGDEMLFPVCHGDVSKVKIQPTPNDKFTDLYCNFWKENLISTYIYFYSESAF